MNLREIRRRIRVNRMRYPLIDGSLLIVALHVVPVGIYAAFAILTK